ncbi:MAG: hypothetical protein GY850_27980 [bacterium]|nr:hypothetical protein [bacterium]
MTHDCKHESDITLIKDAVKRTEKTTQSIYKILNGNGQDGIVTEVALLKQSNKRSWWWLGGISFAILGLLGVCVKVAIA